MAYSNFYAKFYAAWQLFSRQFAHFIKFPPTLVYLSIIAAWQILTWWQAWNIRRHLSTEVLILHYNVDFGIDLIGQANNIYYLPVLALLIVLLNIILTLTFFRRPQGRLLLHFLLSATMVFSIFVNIALFVLFLINFR